MKIKLVKILGMKMEKWNNRGCSAYFGVGKDYATLYNIYSKNQGKGEATELLIKAKRYYEKLDKKFGGSIALNSIMSHLYKKLNIKEYKY